ncbi:hypothetical protein KZC51_05565 [Microbacterium sp. SSW1-49]|uniref:Uncharacterized protein n=2 Tax=Microbacterium croceum TaxID=2851645 RepID=A0ABT0FC12_9MICO|nr:hypothetical protein [Microbacterium croceum]
MDEKDETKETPTMVRTQVAVNEVGFFLAQGQDVADLKRRIESAVQAGGRLVDFLVVGNRSVSVLISASSHVVISVETVEFDTRDFGDDSVQFSGAFDML